jgi:hypothetical protein
VIALISSLRRFVGLLLFTAFFVATVAAADDAVPEQSEPEVARNDTSAAWTQESNAKGIAIHSRVHEGSTLKEFKGVGMIEATPSAVFAILDDTEAYPSFMPYTSECRVLKRAKDWVLAYQRLEVPLVSDRDYTLRSRNAKWLGPDGVIFRIRWTPANDEGPAEKPGVSRVNVCEGGWLLEPDGNSSTRATYSIFTDSGGTLPSFIANNGSRIGIRKVFEAIRKRAKDPKYATAAKAEPRNASTE